MRKIINNIVQLSLLLIVVSCQKNEGKETFEKPYSVQVQNKTERPEIIKPRTNTIFKKFSGAWFDIEYPADFKAENSLKSSTGSEGFDSAIFTSPDGKVQFYVFSPQWSGDPIDIKVKAGERITETAEEKENGLFVKRWTVQANDGSYSRSYEETSETKSNVNKVFGIKYVSEADLENYRSEYLHFKNSLEQYAD